MNEKTSPEPSIPAEVGGEVRLHNALLAVMQSSTLDALNTARASARLIGSVIGSTFNRRDTLEVASLCITDMMQFCTAAAREKDVAAPSARASTTPSNPTSGKAQPRTRPKPAKRRRGLV